ncbi:MAG: FAD-dependent oxidoreductase [Planctomycetota bacterium]|jgi:hypothetical protein|nr:FAD-dependent oxidoreductase [Planctomycetota bacterium]MDP7248772.1 FAD-dependent oxidoreductase [Planctomycetota bacterium]
MTIKIIMKTVLCSLLIHSSISFLHAQELLVEAESFANRGGWKLDTQFIEIMGSPYLLAHGLGRPVKDATAEVEFPETGEYRVFVRALDWVARWNMPGQPGSFQILVNGQPLEETFGTKGAKWFWQGGGTVPITEKKATLALHDLTGFDGRCDAIFFSKAGDTPPNDSTILPAWRRKLLGLSAQPAEKSGYDLVVIGGGYSGIGAALSAARMGCKVALIQNRGVLGGNGSSEVRVWSQGLIRRGRYPRIGEIIGEFCDRARKSPGTYKEFGDAKKESIVRAEKNIDLFLNHHAFKVDTNSNRVTGVYAFDTRTSEHKKFIGRNYVDCTGHGTIGFLAGADWEMTPKGRMGMSNMWAWGEAEEEVAFPDTPWALNLYMKDFPYPRAHHGQWFWESGFDKDPIKGAEEIRDWNLRAVYGSFNAMKNRDGAAKHKNAYLTWIAYIGGPRESRRLLGDVVLSQDDIVTRRQFPDGSVPSTWSIDLHYPKKQYAKKYPDNPFISIAKHDRRVDRAYGYPVPYRCFYSRNIENLFMAGRCISVTHEALGTVRVMKTCGMMGEVVGKAASICALHDCYPRAVYETHLKELDELLKLPGLARRKTVKDEIVLPEKVPPIPVAKEPAIGVDPKKLPGLIIDDRQAKRKGRWTAGTGLKGYIGWNYLYSPGDSNSSVRFEFQAPSEGRFDIRIAWSPHKNRGTQVPVKLEIGEMEKEQKVNMSKPAPLKFGFFSLGKFEMKKGQTGAVTVSTKGAGGYVHADAVQVMPVE